MKEILIIVIPIISTLVGVLLGWGCTELSRHFSNSYQKKQTLNSALSLLLELYFQMNRIQDIHKSVQDLTKWYMETLKEQSISEEVKTQIQGILNGVITPILSSVASDDIQKLSADYESALKKLSCYYPVATYRLRGRADIKRILVDMGAYYRKIEEQISYPISDYEGILISLQSFLQPVLIQDNLCSLKTDIFELAKDANCKQRKEIKTALNNIAKQDSSLEEQYLNLLKDQILMALNNEVSK